MKNSSNPINRFIHNLNVSTQDVANVLELSLSAFQKLSASKNEEGISTPEKLMKMIEEKTACSFAQAGPSTPHENVTEEEKAHLFTDLLIADSQKKSDFRKDDLRQNKDIKISKKYSSGQPYYTIEDIADGTPLSPGKNLLTYEFSKLLYLDAKALAELGRFSPAIHMDIPAVGKKCPEFATGELTLALLIEALKAELARILTTPPDGRLKAILLFRDLAVVEGIFKELKKLHAKHPALNDTESKLHRRFKDWFSNQFNLSKSCFRKAMSEGATRISDMRNRKAQEARVWEIPVEHLGAILVFADAAPIFSLRSDGP
jgi:hypothetical protein